MWLHKVPEEWTVQTSILLQSSKWTQTPFWTCLLLWQTIVASH